MVRRAGFERVRGVRGGEKVQERAVGFGKAAAGGAGRAGGGQSPVPLNETAQRSLCGLAFVAPLDEYAARPRRRP